MSKNDWIRGVRAGTIILDEFADLTTWIPDSLKRKRLNLCGHGVDQFCKATKNNPETFPNGFITIETDKVIYSRYFHTDQAEEVPTPKCSQCKNYAFHAAGGPCEAMQYERI